MSLLADLTEKHKVFVAGPSGRMKTTLSQPATKDGFKKLRRLDKNI